MTVFSSDDTCEWDSEKNLINIKKHHLSFETASKVFLDPLFLDIADEEHSKTEQRYQGFGNINGIAVVTVFYYGTVFRRKGTAPLDFSKRT